LTQASKGKEITVPRVSRQIAVWSLHEINFDLEIAHSPVCIVLEGMGIYPLPGTAGQAQGRTAAMSLNSSALDDTPSFSRIRAR
jgi:hypothetical protein